MTDAPPPPAQVALSASSPPRLGALLGGRRQRERPGAADAREAPGGRPARCADACANEKAEAAPLCGRRLAMVCAAEDAPPAMRFRSAAERLGAQVVPLPADGLLEGNGGLAALVMVLGQLYDGVECQDLPASTVRLLAERATVPVFDGLGGSRGPCAAGAEAERTETDRAVHAIEAALLRAFRIEGA